MPPLMENTIAAVFVSNVDSAFEMISNTPAVSGYPGKMYIPACAADPSIH